jgi:hypothetical protein
LLQAAIDHAEEFPDDIERVTAAIKLLRQRQLARADVQAKVAAIFARRISRRGRR